MSFDNWKWIAEKLGIPTMFLLLICFALYTSVSWTVQNVAKPVVEKHLEFLETEQNSMRTIADSSSKQTTSVEKIVVEMKAQTGVLDDIKRSTADTKKNTEDIRNDQRKFPAVAEKMP